MAINVKDTAKFVDKISEANKKKIDKLSAQLDNDQIKILGDLANKINREEMTNREAGKILTQIKNDPTLNGTKASEKHFTRYDDYGEPIQDASEEEFIKQYQSEAENIRKQNEILEAQRKFDSQISSNQRAINAKAFTDNYYSKKAEFAKNMQGNEPEESLESIMNDFKERSSMKQYKAPQQYHYGETVNNIQNYMNEINAANGNAKEIEAINQKYNIGKDTTAAKHFKNIGDGKLNAEDYIWGYKMPQYAVGGAVAWGAISNVFSNKGRQSNSELYGSPF